MFSFPLLFLFSPGTEGENSGGKPVPAESGAPVSAVRTDDDDGDQGQAGSRKQAQLPVEPVLKN